MRGPISVEVYCAVAANNGGTSSIPFASRVPSVLTRILNRYYLDIVSSRPTAVVC